MYVERLKPDENICDAYFDLIKSKIARWSGAKARGVTKDHFLSQQIPTENVEISGQHKECASFSLFDNRQEEYEFGEKLKQIAPFDAYTNGIVYPPMSYMPWHTNSDVAGYRTYYSYTLKEGVFAWKCPDTGEIKVDYDDYGWTCRRFKIINKPPYLWHTIWSEGLRFAFGFNTRDKH